MCEFVSWLEHKGKVLFLTNKEMKSRRGKELIAHTVDKTDLVGHGSILWFYDLKRTKTIQRECEDFSSPDNFPKEIVDAIKSGQMSFFNVCPKELLSGQALEQYKSIKVPAWEQYKAIKVQAWEQYKAIEGQALEQYKAIKVPALEQYKAIEGQAFWKLFSDPQNRAGAWK